LRLLQLLLLLLLLLGGVEEGTEVAHCSVCANHFVREEGSFLLPLHTTAAAVACCCCCCCCLVFVVVFFALGMGGGGERRADYLGEVRGWSEAYKERE